MVNGIGSSGGGDLAKQAIEAALKRSQEASNRMSEVANSANGGVNSTASDPNSFASKITESVNGIAESSRGIDALPEQLATGQVTDIHEVAARIKQAQLSLKFALEVRNKFIDAYQEVMRMSV